MEISNFPVQILNLLKKQVQIQVEPSQTELVIFPNFVWLSLIQPYQVLQWEFPISLSRFGISLKNAPRYKLNDPIWSRSPDPLLVLQSPFWVQQVLQAKIGISVFRFMISSKNESGCKSNHPKQRESNFTPPGFRQYFAFSCLIRNSTVMGTPDLESTQTGAPGDAQIVHFGQDPICAKITPSEPSG